VRRRDDDLAALGTEGLPVTRARAAALVVALVSFFLATGARDALAGPYFTFVGLALDARRIVEVEVTVPPKRDRVWRRGRPYLPARPLRVVFNRDGGQIPPITTEVPTACEEPAHQTGTMRELVFLDYDPQRGLEHRRGGFTSLNPDYPKIVEAVSIVSGWRARGAADPTWKREIELVTGTANPYLKFLGAWFLIKTVGGDAARAVEPMSHASDEIASPAAPCFMDWFRAHVLPEFEKKRRAAQRHSQPN
jgi:hypothetical protein